MKLCEICGTKLKDDLFAFVTQEPVCAICKIRYIGGLPTTPERIAKVRQLLVLAPGQYIVQDNTQAAAEILGHFMTQIQKMEIPVTVTLKNADWWVIQGLLTAEWSKIGKEAGWNTDRQSYYETLTNMRREISRRCPE